MINLSTVFVLVVHLLGCKPDDVAPEQSIAPQSPVVWKKPLEIMGLTSTPHYYQGRIIFGHQAKEKNNYLVYCLDARAPNGSSRYHLVWQCRYFGHRCPHRQDPHRPIQGIRMVVDNSGEAPPKQRADLHQRWQ